MTQKEPRLTYRIFQRQLRVLVKLANKHAKSDGFEICGLLISNGYCLDMVLVKNKTKRPGGFSFYSRQVSKIERAAILLKHNIVGTFHSHPWSSAEPGENDIKYTENGSLMLIISCSRKETKLWHICNGKYYPVNIEYI